MFNIYLFMYYFSPREGTVEQRIFRRSNVNALSRRQQRKRPRVRPSVVLTFVLDRESRGVQEEDSDPLLHRS